MWYKVEGGTARPDVIDTTSSKKYNYTRRNIEHLEETEDLPERWVWEEQKIEKENWDTYQATTENTSTLEDVQEALIEIAGIITEG